MIEWVEAGKRILEQNGDIDPVERAVLKSQLKATEQVAFALQRALAVTSISRDPQLVNQIFAERYPEYVKLGYAADLKATLAIDCPYEVRRLNHRGIHTEHLLLGLLHPESSAQPLLLGLGFVLEDVRQKVVSDQGIGERPSPEVPALSPLSKKILQVAQNEAEILNIPLVNGQHLLLGLLNEGIGVAANLLERRGVSLYKVRELVAAQ